MKMIVQTEKIATITFSEREITILKGLVQNIPRNSPPDVIEFARELFDQLRY